MTSTSPAFLGLPWELLQDPDHPSPLALEIVRVNRTIPTSRDAAEQRSGDHLRVLMVLARPHGARDVPYQMVARPLLERLDAVSGQVEVEVLRPPTIEALRQKLDAARQAGTPYDVLHFDGHGTFGEIAATTAPGNRPGMAMTYGQLGLLAEGNGQAAKALDWTVRCVALFPELPHPATGLGPQHLARLTADLSMQTLEASWQRCTGTAAPEACAANRVQGALKSTLFRFPARL